MKFETVCERRECLFQTKIDGVRCEARTGPRQLNFEICDSFVQGETVFCETDLVGVRCEAMANEKTQLLKFPLVLSKERVCFLARIGRV